MTSLKCPSCGHDILDATALPGGNCPQCGKAVHPAKEPGRAEATHNNASDPQSPTMASPATSASGRRPLFDFLKPPQGPDDLGELAHYRIIKLLGQGGMGMVFKAIDVHLQRDVALKVIRPEMSKDLEFRKRFMREAQTTAKVRSDHIVTIHQVGLDNEVPYLAMEFLQGETLENRLDRQGRLSITDTLRLAIETAKGLAAAHESGLVHRDIKPANIWIEESTGRVKILDFGLARPSNSDTRLTSAGVVMGTPDYMAPEQAEGAEVDQRSDLFSLGCVIYQMAAGEKPFGGGSTMAVLKAVALRDPKPLVQLNPKVPQSLANLISQLLAKKPEDRPATAQEVVDHLQAIVHNPSVRLPAFRSGGGSRRWLLAGGLLAVLGLVLGYFVYANFLVSQPPQGDIVLGMSGPFSGTTQLLGRQMEVGIKTYFNAVNDQGGIAGRKLKLVPLDDGYDPDRALANMEEFYKVHKALGVIGNVGTPTAAKTLPFAREKNMLFFGAYSGARLLRQDPPDRVVFNYRASYEDETAHIVRYLLGVKKIKPEEIAVFAQQDGYGEDGFRGVVKVLRKDRDATEILRVGYERGSKDVSEAVANILKHPEIRAVVMVATYQPAARFIQQVKATRKDMIFTNVSFVGTDALVEELGSKIAEGVIVTQVVPEPRAGSTLASRYRNLLKLYYPNEHPSFVSLEGYITANILCEGIARAGANVTMDSLVAGLESISNLDLGLGARINFSPSDHQAQHKVWTTVLDNTGKTVVLDFE